MSNILKCIILIVIVISSNCKETEHYNSDNVEMLIQRFISEKAKKTLDFDKVFDDDYKITKIPMDSILFKFDVYKAQYLLASPSVEFYVAYSHDENKIIDLGEFKNDRIIGFSRILNLDRIDDELDVKVVISSYLEIIFDGVSLEEITDIPGADIDSEHKVVIHPIEIKKEDNTWLIELFTWSNETGKILKHEIKINTIFGLKDTVSLVAENIGKWERPM